jgi:hypothetical protein
MIKTAVHDYDPMVQVSRISPEYVLVGGDLRCNFCGSMSVEQVLSHLDAGAKLQPADRKYGWPHKWYVVGDSVYAKFYSLHAKEATPEQHELLSKAMGLRLHFTDTEVRWSPV